MIKRHIGRILDRAHSQKYQTLNVVEVSSKNIISNFNLFHSLNPEYKTIAVLKANAYGHGLMQVAKILDSVDCAFIAVDGYFEANKIRHITKHNILVMGYVLPINLQLLDNKKCSFVIQDTETLIEIGKSKKAFRVHLEINTGMNRLGVGISEIKKYLEVLDKYKNLELEGIMTHLADADNHDPTYTKKQTKIFDEAVAKVIDLGFGPKFVHIAQSAGSTKVSSKYANCTRIGIGLYGINPLSANDKSYSKLSGLKPALELKSTIIKILDLGTGEKISYNGSYTTSKPSRIAVIPVGYYEGVPRELSNKGVFTAGNHKLPITGRVCMNHTMVDITGTNLKVGDSVTIINANNNAPNSIQSTAQKFNLFTYDLLTRLAESIRRVVV